MNEMTTEYLMESLKALVEEAKELINAGATVEEVGASEIGMFIAGIKMILTDRGIRI